MISFALKPVLSSVPSDALRDSKLSRNRTDIAAITEDAKERPEREPEHAGGLPDLLLLRESGFAWSELRSEVS